MALTQISTGGVKDDAASQAKIADEAIDEARLQISNAGTNGQFLSKQSGNTGGLTWASPPDTNTQVGGATGVDFNDDVKARFGTGNDLEIYHDANHSWVKNTTGNVVVHTGTGRFKVWSGSNEEMIDAVPNGEVKLMYDDSKKLETTSAGITVTGTVSDSKGDLRSIPYSGNSGAYTLVASDAGKVVGADTSWTIPASTFSAGDAVTLLNLGGTALGLTASALTYLWNTADGVNVKASTLTLGARSMATVYFKSANEAFIQASKLNVS